MNLSDTLTTYSGPIWVTLITLAVYYGFMVNVLREKLRLKKKYREDGKKFDRYFSQDPQMLAADRTQLNMLEHLLPFLALLWLHAWAVGPKEATALGALYTGTRALYPLVLGGTLALAAPNRIMLITVTGYAVLGVMAARIAMAI
jgi:hypothetical protein